jgi:putative hydrolase of the HAD superfamily
MNPPKATSRAANGNATNKADAIACLFLDVGGVVLTDGWDHHALRRAATHFRLDRAETEARHHLTWDTHQAGKLTLDEYLHRVVFYQRRSFTRAQFRRFMFAQSRPHPEMLRLIPRLKAGNGLRIVVVSNEGRELNAHRIGKFKLAAFVDAFVTSCFVHVLKPDADIFRLALDIAQVPPRRVVYIDDTAMFVEVAEDLGIRGIHHTSYSATCARLASFGLRIDDGVIHEAR